MRAGLGDACPGESEEAVDGLTSSGPQNVPGMGDGVSWRTAGAACRMRRDALVTSEAWPRCLAVICEPGRHTSLSLVNMHSQIQPSSLLFSIHVT